VADAFANEVISLVTNGDEEGQPGFTTLKQFVDAVADRVDFQVPAGGPAELILDFSFDHTFDVASYEVNFGDGLGDLKDFDLDAGAMLNVDASVAVDLELGIKLAQPGSTFNPLNDPSTYENVNGSSAAVVNSTSDTITINGLSNGDRLIYRMDASPIGGLVDGGLYHVVQATSNSFKLASQSGGTPIQLTAAAGGTNHRFDRILGLQFDTPLSALQGGKGIPDAGDGDTAADLLITLRDGTAASIDLSAVTTVGGLVSALKAPVFGTRLDVGFAEDTDPVTGLPFYSGLQLIDRSIGSSESQLRVQMLGDSLAAAALNLLNPGQTGIFVTPAGELDEVTHGIKTGALHGQSIADNLYIKQVSDQQGNPLPMFSASAALTAGINGSVHLGFLDIGVTNATAQGLVGVDFTLPDPDRDGKITGNEIIEVADSLGKVILPKTVDFSQPADYSGTVVVEFEKADGSMPTVNIPFTVPAASTPNNIDALANAMNASLAGSADPNATRIRVSSAMGMLTFELKDRADILRMTVHGAAGNQSLLRLGLADRSLATFVLKPNVSGSAHFDMPYTLSLNVAGLTLPTEQRLVFDVPDLMNVDLSLPDVLNLDNLGLGDGLSRLKNLSAGDIFDALQGAFELLTNLEAFQNAPFLNKPLPLLGTDLRSVLNMASTFGEFISALNQDPVMAIGLLDDHLENLLGITDDTAVELSLDTTQADPALRIDLQMKIGEGGFGFGGGVEPLHYQAPVNIDLASLGSTSFTKLLDAKAAATLDLEGIVELNVSLGIELSDGGVPVPFLYDYNQTDGTGTNLALLVKAEATDMHVGVSVGAIGATLQQKPLAEDPTHKFAFGKQVGNTTDYARFAVELTDLAAGDDGRHYLNELAITGTNALSSDDFNFAGDGDVVFNADLAFAGLPLGPFPVAFAIPSLGSLTDGLQAGDFTFTINGVTADQALTQVKNALAGDFDLLSFVGGWDGAFDLLLDAMEGEVFGINLPFIGDKLKDQAKFLRNIKDAVSGNLGDNADNEQNGVFGSIFQDIREDLLDALGPNGLDILKDKTVDNSVTIDDIVVGVLNPGPGIGFELLLGSDLGKLDLPIGFDLGIPGLGLDIDADVEASLGFEFGLSMGVDIDHGFFIDTNESFLKVFVDVAIPNLNASGELGFLRLDANLLADQGMQAQASALIGKDKAEESQLEVTSVARGSGGNFDVRIVPDDGVGEQWRFTSADRALTLEVTPTTTAQDLVDLITNTPQLATYFTAQVVGAGDGVVTSGQRALGVSNSFVAQFSVDLLDPALDGPADGKLSFNEIVSVESFKDVIAVNVLANASLDLHLYAGFGVTAKFPSLSTEMAVDWDFQLGNDIQLPVVHFVNIQLGLGEFLSGFAGGVFEEVEKVLEPVRPIISFLSEKLPVISELQGGSFTILDFLKLQGGRVAQAAAFIEAVKQLDSIISNIPDLGNAMLPIGNATYDPNAEGDKFTIDGGLVDAFSAMKDAFTTKAPATGGFDPSNFLQSEEDLAAKGDDKLKLGFPILSPANILKLLGGEQVDLFTLELPTLTLDAGVKKFFPLPPFPAVGIELAGNFNVRADFAFGFDTLGINQFKQTGDFLDILNGFYVFDHETADGEGPDISEVVMSASVTAAAALDAGILKATVGGGLSATVDFNLHDEDDDGKVRLNELLDSLLLGPIHVFDVSGRFDAELFATITVDLGLFEIDKKFTIAEVNLFKFDIPRPSGSAAPLAELQGSNLVLNIGDRAGQRNPTGLLGSIGDEQAVDYRIFAGSAPGDIIVESFGRTQLYQGVSRITGVAGQYDDTIIVSEDVTIPVYLTGGAGNDTIVGGSGNDQLIGGDGNDNVSGGRGNDELQGNNGLDTLNGDQGNDSLDGGAGNDKLFGGDGDDAILAGAGDDEVDAGSGDDFVDGQDGNDVI
ncbi:MAG: hypothetical protein KDB00_27025, partial [Planctomycetales bacterium]|nr:hypothetical protein [Planctomycetales bacterium]